MEPSELSPDKLYMQCRQMTLQVLRQNYTSLSAYHEDICSEVVPIVMEAAQHEPAPTIAYLWAVCRNNVACVFRQYNAWQENTVPLDDNMADSIPAPNDDGKTDVIREWLAKLYARLTDNQKLVLKGKYKGWTAKQIAQYMYGTIDDCHVARVYQCWQGIKKIAKQMGAPSYE